jgi:endoglucanase
MRTLTNKSPAPAEALESSSQSSNVGGHLRYAFLALMLSFCQSYAATDNSYGGWLELKGTKTGFFHTEQIQSRWWLVSPEGNAFFSKGVDHVDPTPESNSSKAPDDRAAWAKSTAEQLRGWNFNTLGAWSSPQIYTAGLAYTPMVDVAASAGRDVWLKGGVVDYFSPEFQRAADRAAQRICAPRAKDPWVLGYFTDNELRWGPDWRGTNSLLEEYLKMPVTAAGYQKATAFLQARGQAADSPRAEDKNEFLGLVAAEYARVASEAIRRADPNHLVLGCRFAVYPGDTVIRAVGRYFDAISYHSYNSMPPVERLRWITELTGKPTLLTEFSFKAMDSGLPNTKGAAKPVATQEDRAKGFAGYAEALAALPGCVGYHWFQYRDQPKEGRRLDGENSNYGVVKIDGSPWETLTARMKEVNGGIEARHAASAVTSSSLEVPAFQQNARLGRGVNILGWDALWQNRERGQFKEHHFKLIREAGFQHVRINLHPLRDGKPDAAGRLRDEFFKTMDWAVDQALANQLLVILDFHDDLAISPDPEGKRKEFLDAWAAIAEHSKTRPDTVLFEILNEPAPKFRYESWQEYWQAALALIRKSNPDRTVIIGPAMWNGVGELDHLKLPSGDTHIIATVHYYNPFPFTHQGTPWTGQKDKVGVSWSGTESELQAVEEDLAKVSDWSKRNNRPIYIGEFGSYEKADLRSRVRWTEFVARQFERHGWSWGYWQFADNFAVFDMPTQKWVEPIRDALIPH